MIFANQKERVVLLSGEGYFEVAKDRRHLFIVKTTHQKIKVLGTHFNVNSYNDEPTVKTTLPDGHISVTANQNTMSMFPGPILSESDNDFFSKKSIIIQENRRKTFDFLKSQKLIMGSNRSILFSGVRVKVQEGITLVLPITKKPPTRFVSG